MYRVVKSSRGASFASILSIALGAVAGCGVVYTPQEFKESSLTYGFKGGLETPIDVIPLTFLTVRAANADNYVPRSLPPIFSDAGQGANSFMRDRLAALNLDTVAPANLLDLPPPPVPYSEGSEVVPLELRDTNRSPLSLPPLSIEPLPGYRSGSQGGYGSDTAAQDTPFDSGFDLETRLDPPKSRRRASGTPLPDVARGPYRIGPGDVLELQVRSQIISSIEGSGGPSVRPNQRLLVHDNGQIFLPETGGISVGGLTLDEARSIVGDRLVSSRLGFDSSIQITTFGSQNVAVSGLSTSKLLPITVRPTTLSQAVVSSGGFGANPDDTIVRVLREGTIYEMSGQSILSSGDLGGRLLLDGDIVSVTSGYDTQSVIAYFDQQVRLREIERTRFDDARIARNEARAAEDARRQDARFDLELRNYRLEAERLRREEEVTRLQSQRETDQINERSRLANIQARQAYLDRLRALKQLNRDALIATRRETRETLLANQAERNRERADRRALLELELQNERAQLDRLSDGRRETRDLFNERVRLGAIEQDYVTVAGETRQQTVMALPFEGRLTLNRVLYEKANGINPISGDTSEIYVIRMPRRDRADQMLTAYHLNAANPAALVVASVFEMRPNDVIYVNPQPITKWNRVLTQILPSTGLLQSGISAVSGGVN